MKFMVITITPPLRTLLGTSQEKVEFTEIEAIDIDWVKTHVQVPLYGRVHIIPKENVTTLHTRIIQEEV
jgi:hypothetical protein